LKKPVKIKFLCSYLTENTLRLYQKYQKINVVPVEINNRFKVSPGALSNTN